MNGGVPVGRSGHIIIWHTLNGLGDFFELVEPAAGTFIHKSWLGAMPPSEVIQVQRTAGLGANSRYLKSFVDFCSFVLEGSLFLNY